MKQSYKIYINDVMVVLAQHKQVFNIPKKIGNAMICWCNKEDELKKIIIALEIQTITQNLIIVSKDLDWLRNTFMSNFKIIKAGGGFVVNKKNEILMIFRKGKWDLPKGKIEKKEAIKDGAVREVTEETGVAISNVMSKLGNTYHTYKLRDKWMLKESHWYYMYSDKNQKLIPQLEEDIEEVRWVNKEEAKKLLKNSFNSIDDVFRMAYDFQKSLK